MSLLNPITETIQPKRPTEVFGEETFVDLPPLEAVVSLQIPYRAATEIQSRFLQGGTVFVRRGSDLEANDIFTYRGHTFRVQGWARGDQDHPFTGDNLGWMQFTIMGGS